MTGSPTGLLKKLLEEIPSEGFLSVADIKVHTRRGMGGVFHSNLRQCDDYTLTEREPNVNLLEVLDKHHQECMITTLHIGRTELSPEQVIDFRKSLISKLEILRKPASNLVSALEAIESTFLIEEGMPEDLREFTNEVLVLLGWWESFAAQRRKLITDFAKSARMLDTREVSKAYLSYCSAGEYDKSNVDHTRSYLCTVRTITKTAYLVDLFTVDETDYILIPEGVFIYLQTQRLVGDFVMLETPLDPRTFEAFKVLHSPGSNTVYSSMQTAHQAALVL